MVNITVLGAGYVGLVTSAGLAHLGHHVVCIDTDAAKIQALNNGELPIYEEGLTELVANARSPEPGQLARLRFQSHHDDRSFASDVYFLCVPTPQASDGSADVSYLEQAAADIGPGMPAGALVITKSTVPVGSAELVRRAIARPDVGVVSNPEFLREGSAVRDFLEPDRIVIGADDAGDGDRVQQLYAGIETTFVHTDPASAELIKYASNSFLATKLSFVNTIAEVCEGVGADIADVRLGMGLDHRIGLDYFSPGPGWGGSCFPKDTNAMMRIADRAGCDFPLVRAAIDTNEAQLERVTGMVLGRLDRAPQDAVVGVLGLAFKAGTDDTRMSPAISIIERLRSAGVEVSGYDPVARPANADFTLAASAIEACRGADVVLVATEWPEFAELDLATIVSVMQGSAIVDTRMVIDRHAADLAGVQLVQIGRG